jgi:catechol 2,3-dioxygenase-like lactoylglutathione lyase family enzyme
MMSSVLDPKLMQEHGAPAGKIAAANRGKLDRRYLLQALGLTATSLFVASAVPKAAAALAASVAQNAGNGGETFSVTTVNHLALASNDYAKSRDFYVDLFGMRLAWDNGNECALEFGSLTSPNGIYIRPVGTPGAKLSIAHIAFGIPNFKSQKAAMKVEMQRRGVKNIHHDGEMGWSCDDPAGYPLDIWVPEKDKAMFPGAAGPCEVAESRKCAAAWEAGQKNLGTIPQPGGKGFKATSYSFIALNVPDISKERDFYKDLLGMKVIYDRAEEKGECFLRFGPNTLHLRKTSNPRTKPYCNQFGFTVESYNQNAVEAELKRRGLQPKPDSKLSWSIADPDGYQIDVSGPGFSEHIANDCHGSAATCTGGPTG